MSKGCAAALFPVVLVALALAGETATPPAPCNTVITMVPGEYMPGRRPQGVGPPLHELSRVAREYEARHPGVRIQFQNAGGADLSEGEYIKTQIMSGMAPDIVAVNAEVVWPDVGKQWWVPLDPWLERPNPYVEPGAPGSKRWWDLFANPTLAKAKYAPDGHLYSLTFDLVETAIFYNKTLFKKPDLHVPRTWTEFIRLQEHFRRAGYVPFAVSIVQVADWGQDFFFDQLYYPVRREIAPAAGERDRAAYLKEHLFARELCLGIARGSLSVRDDRSREMWRLMREWRRYWPKDLLRPDVTRLFVLQESPMIWSGSWLVRRLRYDPLVGFDWGVFYLPPITSEGSPFAHGVEPAVFGGAGTQYSITRAAVTRGHLDQVVDFLAYLTSPQVAKRVIGEAGMFIPNIVGADMPPALEAFEDIIKRRYCVAKWSYSFDNRFNDINRRLIELYLGDGLTLDEFLEKMDENNQATAARLIRQRGWDPKNATEKR